MTGRRGGCSVTPTCSSTRASRRSASSSCSSCCSSARSSAGTTTSRPRRPSGTRRRSRRPEHLQRAHHGGVSHRVRRRRRRRPLLQPVASRASGVGVVCGRRRWPASCISSRRCCYSQQASSELHDDGPRRHDRPRCRWRFRRAASARSSLTRRRRAQRAHRPLGGRQRGRARRGGGRSPASGRFGDRRAGGSPATGGSTMNLFGLRRFRGHRRARVLLGPARPVRGDGALRAQLHQGAAVDGGDLLRPQAHARRREGQPIDGRLPRGARRRGAARAGARAGRVPLAQHHLDPAARSSGPTRRKAWPSPSRRSPTSRSPATTCRCAARRSASSA